MIAREPIAIGWQSALLAGAYFRLQEAMDKLQPVTDSDLYMHLKQAMEPTESADVALEKNR